MTRSLQSCARWTAILALPVFLLLAADVQFHGALAQWDPLIARAIHPVMASPRFINLARTAAILTYLGDTPVTATIVILITLGLLVAQRKRLLAAWLGAALGCIVLTDGLKWLFARPRPAANTFFPPHGGYSFPSGHTMGAVVIYSMLAYVFYRLHNHPQVGRFFAALAAALIGLVSVSLLLIGVHYLTDILAALALGATWVGLVITWAEATPAPAAAPRRKKRAPAKRRAGGRR